MRPLQRHILGIFITFVLSVLLFAGPSIGLLHAKQKPITINLFWQQGCPHCAGANTALTELVRANPLLRLRKFQVGNDTNADRLFTKTLASFGHKQAAVPLVIIGDRSFLGFFDDGRSAELYRQAVERCQSEPCPDLVGTLSKQPVERGDNAPLVNGSAYQRPARHVLPEVFDLPVIGEVRPRDLSLPALTVLLAAIDGFNPCAMWVLVFLIGLLLGLKDEKRMWILGGAFLGATAVMYLAVMAAWLNLLVFLGVVVWVRTAIGVLAVGGGVFFLREYWTKPEAACRVTNPTRRQKVMNAFRSVVNGEQLVLSVLGIMALAVMVNFIELLCSAGIPAVYTQILVLNDLPPTAYYGYLLLYITVFMIDDLAIFATAMFALRVSGLTGSYARVSHLIGGVALLVIGAIMLLRPELLSFG